jgi:hypothetical protein
MQLFIFFTLLVLMQVTRRKRIPQHYSRITVLPSATWVLALSQQHSKVIMLRAQSQTKQRIMISPSSARHATHSSSESSSGLLLKALDERLRVPPF